MACPPIHLLVSTLLATTAFNNFTFIINLIIINPRNVYRCPLFVTLSLVFCPKCSLLAESGNSPGILGQGNQFFTDQAWRENVYTFALTNSFGYGTMIMFQVQSTEDQTISATKLQLVRGACNNAIVTPNFPKFFDNYWCASQSL